MPRYEYCCKCDGCEKIILQKFLVLVALKMALQSGFLILLQFKKALLLMKRNSEQQISEGKWLSL
jgi:hypothetical protein